MDYFKDSEFNCNCCEEGTIVPELRILLNGARAWAEIPFVINSGFRCAKHNVLSGGSLTSSHLKGFAVDIACDSSRARYKIMEALTMVGIKRVGLSKDFIHCDIDPDKVEKVVWVY